MAVLARSSITLVTSVDIDSVYWFYLLQASTAAAPAKPTTVPATKGNAPSGWTTAEPTSVDINKTLYRVELTYFTDGTGVYSSVNKVSSYEAAKVAYNKATDVQTNLDDTYDKLQSMGEQLVVNGNAFTGDNTNFTAWTFDGAVANGTKGSFTKASDWNGTPMTNESFPIDITKRYRFEFDAKSKDKTARHYSFLNFFDVDGNTIYAYNHMFIANTLTTLAQDLKNGDTVVYLTDLTNWKTSTGTATHQRGLTFWNYKNSFGYQYPELTYTRNVWTNLYTDANVDKTAKTITLSSPWSHGTIPAGTKVSQSNSGSNYKYNPWSNSLVETEWTHYVGYYEGTDYSGNNVQTKFPPGAATAKVGFLWNYQKQSTTDQLWITNVSVMEDVKTSISNAQTTATNAQTTANTAKTIANSKKSMIKINLAPRSFSTAQWQTYGAAGHSESWTTGSSYSNPDIKVGDTAYIVGTVTDETEGSATIIGTVTAVNGTNGTTSIVMTSQQLIFGGDSVYNAWLYADDAYDYANTANTKANTAKTAADNALINTKYNGPINIGAAVTANRLIMNTTTAANTAASYKMVAKNTAYNIESPILYSATALSTGNIALANHTCYLIGNVNITGQGGVSSLTVNKPVFLKGTLSGSTFTTVNDATFITQTQPTSSDNYHYIFLGTATSTTNVMLQAEHPLYMFIGGSFHRLGSSSDKILQTWVGGASVAIENAKLNGSYIQANTVTAEQIYVEDLNALGATIGGFVIDSTSIHTSGIAITSNAQNSVALSSADFTRTISGTSRSGLRLAIGSRFGVSNTGVIYASDAIISGTITATSGEIGGFAIDSTSIHTKNVEVTSNASNSVALSSSTFTRTIGGTSRSSLKLAIGSNFGVSNTGILYAGSAVINGSSTFNGAITATTVRTTANIGKTSHAFNLHRWDHVVVCSLNGCTPSELNINGNAVANGFKPINQVWFTVAVKDDQNKWHMGTIGVSTSGSVAFYVYYEYNNTNLANWLNASCEIFGSTAWFTNDSTYPDIGV